MRIHIVQFSRNPFDLSGVIIWPVVYASIAYYLLVDALRETPDSDPALKVRVPQLPWAPPLLEADASEQADVRELLERLLVRRRLRVAATARVAVAV